MLAVELSPWTTTSPWSGPVGSMSAAVPTKVPRTTAAAAQEALRFDQPLEEAPDLHRTDQAGTGAIDSLPENACHRNSADEVAFCRKRLVLAGGCRLRQDEAGDVTCEADLAGNHRHRRDRPGELALERGLAGQAGSDSNGPSKAALELVLARPGAHEGDGRRQRAELSMDRRDTAADRDRTGERPLERCLADQTGLDRKGTRQGTGLCLSPAGLAADRDRAGERPLERRLAQPRSCPRPGSPPPRHPPGPRCQPRSR